VLKTQICVTRPQCVNVNQIGTKIILSEAAKFRPIYNRLVIGIGITLDENDDK